MAVKNEFNEVNSLQILVWLITRYIFEEIKTYTSHSTKQKKYL